MWTNTFFVCSALPPPHFYLTTERQKTNYETNKFTLFQTENFTEKKKQQPFKVKMSAGQVFANTLFQLPFQNHQHAQSSLDYKNYSNSI